MAEKKTAKKKETKKTTTKKAPAKKVETKKAPSKKVETKKAPAKKVETKKEVKKEVKQIKEKKESKIKKWFSSLTLEQIVIGGFIVIGILLIVLIIVSTKNTKTSNGKDIVAKVNGKTITADELYSELKKQNGQTVTINLIDEYILDKEYKTTDEMKESAKATIENYKKTYGDNYESFLSYNGISDDAELKTLLIKNSKLTLVTEDYIKETLTDKEMKNYYEEKIVGDISAKHILIGYEENSDLSEDENKAKKNEAKAKAEEVIKKLDAGEDFAKLAKEYSTDKGTKDNGGDLGYFNTGDMVEAFEKAAYALDINKYTKEPVETEYGYHVILKTGQKDKPSYEKSKNTIKEKLVEEKKNNDTTISAKAMDALRKKYKLNIKDKRVKKDYNTYIKNATTTTTTTTTAAANK